MFSIGRSATGGEAPAARNVMRLRGKYGPSLLAAGDPLLAKTYLSSEREKFGDCHAL
jgi:hypothetical protein